MNYLAKEDAILSASRGKRVLHLGCVGMTDEAFGRRVAVGTTSLHARLSAAADVVGIDNARDVIDEYARTGLCPHVLPHATRHGITFRLGRAFFKRFPRFGGTLYVVARLRDLEPQATVPGA